MKADALLTLLLDQRVRALNQRPVDPAKPFVLLWLQGQRRVSQNLAWAHAQRSANELGRPLLVYEGLRRDYPHASERLHRFVLEGVADTADDCAKRGLAYAFFLERPGSPRGVLHALSARAALVVTDWLPTFIHPAQSKKLAERSPVRVEVVDAAGVAPLAAFPAAEIGARTLRPKLHKLLPERLREIPEPAAKVKAPAHFDWGFEPLKPPRSERALAEAVRSAEVDASVRKVLGVTGGRAAGLARLALFLNSGLHGYAEARNQPQAQKPSGLSSYLHFGHLGAGEIALAVLAGGASKTKAEDQEAFLEELLVRRELSLNFCARTPGYDQVTALPAWAQRTLKEHEKDQRPALLSDRELEEARTPDPLWNAAQRQLMAEGRIHGYLRMLWGKSLLNWSKDAAESLRRMRWLNDRYALDGRDANSAVGFLWCLGLHDRPFPERAIFGVVRSMTSGSALRKLDLDGYLEKFAPAPER